MKIFLFILCFFLILPQIIFAQEKTEILFINKQNKSWNDFVQKMEQEFNVRFFYDEEAIKNIQIEINEDSVILETALKEIFADKGIIVSKDNQGNYFLFKDFKLHPGIDKHFFQANESFKKIELNEDRFDTISDVGKDFLKTYDEFISDDLVVGTNKAGNSKEKVKVSGVVYDIDNGNPVDQARIYVSEIAKNFVTNAAGVFEMELELGDYSITVSSLGMFTKTFRLTVLSDGTVNLPLKVKSFVLDETIVTAERNQNLSTTTMGFERMTAKTIKELPVMLGEKDIVKMALLLPGVQTIGEISSGFNVRGSPSDQNMFIINDLPIYNSSHLFGLFTTFNSDAINEFKFYKNSIPVEYGGQLSSVFDIEVKKGNNQFFSARAGIGPTSVKAMAEGPIKKDRSSYLVSIRSSYSDWLLKQVNNLDVQNSSAAFQDALIDFNFQLNNNNKLGLFSYWSRDFADLAFGIQNEYSNLGSVVKWSHTFNQGLSAEMSLAMSRYAYEEINREIVYLANQHSFDLYHNEFKYGFKYTNGHGKIIEFGINSKLVKINYGDFLPLNNESSLIPISFEPEQSMSNSLFGNYKWDISPRFSIDAGVRATLYSYLGPKTVYTYLENAPKDIDNITDTIYFGKNRFIKNYNNVDFSLSAKFELTNNFSIKASYNRLHQYTYMLSNTVSVSPTSKWKLSDQNLKPMEGEQFSFGLYKNFADNSIETSIEAYYKNVKNLVEYKDGAEFITNTIPETNILQGDLESYGIEFMLKKKMDKLTGWVNYTWSKAEVTAFNPITGEMNNLGYPYPANYDRPHSANMTMNYKISKRLMVSANVVYSTGRPITFPSTVYYLNDVQITGFSMRNEYRLPDYFRTDLSISLEGNLKKNKLAHGFWSLSFYNLTGRRNTYSMVFQNVDGQVKGYKISILGAVIPTLNYNLKLGNYEN